MAAVGNSKPIYVYELPYQPLQQLCRILDVDKRWKDLGGTYMGYDMTTLLLIEQAIQRDKSPTSDLLDKWGERNGTIKSLFVMLAKMDHQRAMLVLKPYVHEKYHQYIQNDDNGTFTLSVFKRPQFMDTKTSMGSSQSFHSHNKSSYSQSAKCSKYLQNSNFQNDVNMNMNISSPSLQSKMNVLNVSGSLPQSRKLSEKKSPDLRSTLKNTCANCKVESITDNCVAEKIKNVRKLSLPQEILLNGRHIIQPSHLACGSNLRSCEESLPDIMQITYKDICKATDNFNKALILGKGGFGTVYKGEWKGTSVAIKRLTPRDGHDSASQQLVSLKQSINELSVLKCCRFDHILPLYGVSLDGADPCLVYQLMVNGSLEDWLVCRKNTPPLTWSQRSHIAECTAKGLNYLHTTPDKPLVHGDVKSANILLDSNMDAKIGDFGLTREGPGYDRTHVKVSSLHGTECYLPPEYLRQRHLSPQVDIYSYGIVLLEMATGLRPYDPKRGKAKLLVDYVSDCNTSGRLDSLRDAKAGEENMIWFRELLQIGQKCSSKEKKKRPPMLEVLEQFDKVKEEMSMVDKIRRLSNDKSKMVEDSEMKKLSPIQLQIFYDLRNDGQGPSTANEEDPPQPQNRPDVSSTARQDANGPAKDLSFNIRATPSPIIETCNSSKSPVQGSSPSTNTEPKSDVGNGEASPVVTPPMPLITILQMQISEFNDTNTSLGGESVVSDVTSDFNSENQSFSH